MNAANQVAVEGVRAFAKRQAENVQQSLDAAKGAFDQLSKASTSQEAVAKQEEIAQDAFVQAVKNAQEQTDLDTESNTKAAQAIIGRIVEGMNESKDLVGKLQK